jgi:hypothetical protein
MNTRSVWSAGVFFLLAVLSAHAQETKAVAKVLPTEGKGFIKLLVADNAGKSVFVRFYGDEGVIATDEIRGKDAHAFIRRYDLSRVNQKNFRMQVDTENASFTYQLTRDTKGIIAELRETTHTYPVLAAR